MIHKNSPCMSLSWPSGPDTQDIRVKHLEWIYTTTSWICWMMHTMQKVCIENFVCDLKCWALYYNIMWLHWLQMVIAANSVGSIPKTKQSSLLSLKWEFWDLLFWRSLRPQSEHGWLCWKGGSPLVQWLMQPVELIGTSVNASLPELRRCLENFGEETCLKSSFFNTEMPLVQVNVDEIIYKEIPRCAYNVTPGNS